MKAHRLVGVAGGVLPQAKLKVELPGALGEGAFHVLAGQLQDFLVGVDGSGRAGDERAVKPLRDQIDASQQGRQIASHLLGADPPPLELYQAAQQKGRQVAGRKDVFI